MIKIVGLHISKWNLLLFAGDIVLICVSIIAGLSFNPKIGQKTWEFLALNKITFLWEGLVYLVIFYISDLYDHQRDYRRWGNVAKVIIAVLIGSLIIALMFYFNFWGFAGRTFVIIHSLVLLCLIVLWRWSFSALALPTRLRRRLLIMGAGKAGERLLEAIRERPLFGLEVVGFMDDDPEMEGKFIQGVPVVGDSAKVMDLIQEYQVRVVVVAVTHEKLPMMTQALIKTWWSGCQVMDMPSLYEFMAGKIPIEHISNLWLFLQGLQANRLYYFHMKRLFDLLFSILVLAGTWPLFLLIAWAIKLDSPGPVFFQQERLGKDGKSFQIIKFRTMVQDAERYGPQFADKIDPRITRVGKLLRKFRLDELPQMINILKGDMSLIGPRPEREVFIQQFCELVPDVRPARKSTAAPHLEIDCDLKERIPYYSYRLMVKPGVTGWAQVMYPYASSLEETNEKFKFDLYYIKNVGFFLDVRILLKTIRTVLFGNGR